MTEKIAKTLAEWEADQAAGINRGSVVIDNFEENEARKKTKKENLLPPDNYQLTMDQFLRLLKRDAERSAEVFRVAWELALEAKNKAITEATANKTALHDDYWKAEHRARGLYGAALQFVETLS